MSLTDDEAKAMLKQLSEHFHEPVMPIKTYCAGLEAWSKAMYDRATRARYELFPGLKETWDTEVHKAAQEEYLREQKVFNRFGTIYARGEKPTTRDSDLEEMQRFEQLAESINNVFLQIRKSCLLDRLLYGSEQLRTTMCPIHKGTWSGNEFSDTKCPHGCQLTGWIPEEVDREKQLTNAVLGVVIDAKGTMTKSTTGEVLATGVKVQTFGYGEPPGKHSFVAMDPNPLERK